MKRKIAKKARSEVGAGGDYRYHHYFNSVHPSWRRNIQ